MYINHNKNSFSISERVNDTRIRQLPSHILTLATFNFMETTKITCRRGVHTPVERCAVRKIVILRGRGKNNREKKDRRNVRKNRSNTRPIRGARGPRGESEGRGRFNLSIAARVFLGARGEIHGVARKPRSKISSWPNHAGVVPIYTGGENWREVENDGDPRRTEQRRERERGRKEDKERGAKGIPFRRRERGREKERKKFWKGTNDRQLTTALKLLVARCILHGRPGWELLNCSLV